MSLWDSQFLLKLDVCVLGVFSALLQTKVRLPAALYRTPREKECACGIYRYCWHGNVLWVWDSSACETEVGRICTKPSTSVELSVGVGVCSAVLTDGSWELRDSIPSLPGTPAGGAMCSESALRSCHAVVNRSPGKCAVISSVC